MDITVLAEELGLEEEEVRQLVACFLDSTQQDLVLLGEAFSEQDAEKLVSAAHHIKGSAANLELSQIAEAARKIEEKARSGIIENPGPAIEMIRGRLNMIRTQLSTRE